LSSSSRCRSTRPSEGENSLATRWSERTTSPADDRMRTGHQGVDARPRDGCSALARRAAKPSGRRAWRGACRQSSLRRHGSAPILPQASRRMDRLPSGAPAAETPAKRQFAADASTRTTSRRWRSPGSLKAVTIAMVATNARERRSRPRPLSPLRRLSVHPVQSDDRDRLELGSEKSTCGLRSPTSRQSRPSRFATTRRKPRQNPAPAARPTRRLLTT
jgi:hypothetical protein